MVVRVPDANAAGHPAAATEPERLDRVKGVFLASLNHEFRTPLSGIVGMLDLLEETALDTEQREYVEAARQCADSLTELLNASLEYAALEAGEFSLDESEFHLLETLEAAVAQHLPKAEAKGLTLSFTSYANLPETMVGDAGRVRELLGRLISNAIKFTPAGSVEVRALLTGNPAAGERLVLAVSDTGIGIPADKIDLIFKSFHQVEEGLSRNYSGLGLGLALVRKLTVAMGGSVHVESQPGQGSTFTVEIPLQRTRQIPERNSSSGQQKDAAGPVILVVEDNPVGMRVLRTALERRRARVLAAASGREAIEAARNNRVDLILMDLQMPEMDGLEAAQAIRSLPDYVSVPILALTANCSDQMREQCIRSGMQAYLSKPINSQELWAAIRRYLERA